MTQKYTDSEINTAIDKVIAETNPGCPLRVRHIAWDLIGRSSCRTRKIPIPSVLTSKIRKIAADKGYYPDPNDKTHDSNFRLYKGGKA